MLFAGQNLSDLHFNLCKVIDRDLRFRRLRWFYRRFLRLFRFDLFQHFLFIDPRKQNLRLRCYMNTIFQLPESQHGIIAALLRIELIENGFRRFRQITFQQNRRYPDTFQQVIQNGSQTVFLRFVLAQCPRHRFVDIFIASAQQSENFVNRVCDPQFVHLFLNIRRRCFSQGDQFVINRIADIRVMD